MRPDPKRTAVIPNAVQDDSALGWRQSAVVGIAGGSSPIGKFRTGFHMSPNVQNESVFYGLRERAFGRRLRRGSSAGAKEVAEMLRDLSTCEENHPSAAEAGRFPLDLLARINPCPFKTALNLSFSAACEARHIDERRQG
jgi:hypothetical protein